MLKSAFFHFHVMTSLMLVCHWVTDGEKNFWIIWRRKTILSSIKYYLKYIQKSCEAILLKITNFASRVDQKLLHMTSNFAPHSWIMILDFKGSSPPTQRPLFPGVWSKQWARRWEGLPCKHYFLDEHDDLCDHHGHHHPHIMIKSP